MLDRSLLLERQGETLTQILVALQQPPWVVRALGGLASPAAEWWGGLSAPARTALLGTVGTTLASAPWWQSWLGPLVQSIVRTDLPHLSSMQIFF